MKKILPYIFITLIVVVFLLPTTKTSAATVIEQCISSTGKDAAFCANAETYYTHCVRVQGASATVCKDMIGTEKADQFDPTGLTSLTPEQQQNAQNASNPSKSSGVGGIVGYVMGRIGYTILWLMAWLIGVAGWLLNYAIKYTIIDWSANISKMTGINIAWKLFRDLMNIGFIFLLVYQSIKLIIGAETRQSIQGFISKIVLVSLLINFSLFFTKVIIDASNVLTIGMYQNILGNQTDPNVGLSDAYMQNLGLSTIYSGKSLDTFASTYNDDGAKMLLVGIIGGGLFLIVSFVFFATAINFILSYIIRIALLFAAAVGMMGLVPIGMGKWSKQWWTALWGQFLFPPVFMIMTWVTLTLIGTAGFISPNGNPSSFTNLILKPQVSVTAGSQSSIELFINFALIIGLSIMTLTVSKSFATQGASQINKLTGKATAFAGGAVLGGAAVAGKQIVGRTASGLSESKALQEKAVQGGFGGWMARKTLGASQGLSKGSFDVRNTFIGKGIQTGLGTGHGINLGKASTGGFASIRAEQKKNREQATEEVIKKYKNKPEILEKFINRTTIPGSIIGRGEKRDRFFNTSIADQKGLYSKLSVKDRDNFDKHLIAAGRTDKAEELRKSLPREERLDGVIRRNKNNSTSFATEIASISDSIDQQYIYEKLTPRDKVALEESLRTSGNATLASDLRSKLSVDDREKTEREERESKKRLAVQQKLDDIETISSGGTVAGATIDSLIKNLPANQARNLDSTSRKSADVIQRLSVPHLRDLKANGALEQDEIDAITSIIKGSSYPNQSKHTKYITDPSETSFWS